MEGEYLYDSFTLAFIGSYIYILFVKVTKIIIVHDFHNSTRT